MFSSSFVPFLAEHTGQAVLGSLVCLTLCYIGYQLLLHPLRHYPGPFLAKFTDFSNFYQASQWRLHLATWDAHQEYGSVVRQGPNKLVFNSITALRDIYQNDMVTKSVGYLATQYTPTSWFAFNALDKTLHRVKRRLLSQVFADRSLRSFEPTMQAQIDIFLAQLATSDGQPMEMTHKLKRLALDVVALLAFGYPFKTQTEKSHRFMLDSLKARGYRVYLYMQFRWIPKYHLPMVLELPWLRAITRWRTLIREMVSTRVAKEVHALNDLYSFVSGTASKEGLSERDIWFEAFFLLIAGGDTIGTGMSSCFFYLSQNKDCYDRLVNEIRAAFSSSDEIRGGPTLWNCHYLRAVINEALRISPPVSGTLWREKHSGYEDEPLIVDGHVIPPGTEVGINMYALHHNEEYFPEPFAFKPERWLDDETSSDSRGALPFPEEQRKLMQDAFSPFSLGTRGCVGKPFAYLEASLVLAKTLWYFDLDRAAGRLGEVGHGARTGEAGRHRQQEFQLYDGFTSAHEGPYLTFRPRGEYYKELLLEARS